VKERTLSRPLVSISKICTKILPRNLARCYTCHDGVVRILEVDSNGNQVDKRWKESAILGKVSADSN
jgi:hypothetical protein